MVGHRCGVAQRLLQHDLAVDALGLVGDLRLYLLVVAVQFSIQSTRKRAAWTLAKDAMGRPDRRRIDAAQGIRA